MGEEVIEAAIEHSGALIDVGDVPLSTLAQLSGSVLDLALRRVLGEENTGPVAGFQSSI
ncbi:FxSxx-COOH cyclophane-containing RiPP peptide [Planomonospora corallina]|uniref:FxSxx-COOH cyclophane-containing RiPP peptide n=1 Tax=Planomonospora corallina TaxID=1806052 RepID=A0ABV8ICQ2_9ACTN